jgi:hypothetical protein
MSCLLYFFASLSISCFNIYVSVQLKGLHHFFLTKTIFLFYYVVRYFSQKEGDYIAYS